MPPSEPTTGDRHRDLRMPALGAAAWLAALGTHQVGAWALAPGALVLLAAALGRVRGSRCVSTVGGVALVAGAVAGAALLRQQAVADNPVADLARERAAVSVTGTVVSDPRPVSGRYTDQVLVRVEVREVTGRGVVHRLATPVLVLGGEGWSEAPLGATVRTSGLLVASDDTDVSGVLTAARDPVVVARPDVWWRAAGAVRASVRDSVGGRPADQRALVPALVDGDDAGLDPALAEDFRTTGLTHLTAVSGTNLTLVVGFVLLLARWCRVRGRWLYLVGGCGILGFVLIARTEPSVLRAAVMGTVGLLAMGVNGQQRAFRALGVAVVVLLLVQPALAVSVGFALSVLATAGIVVLAPGWRDALARWTPRWVAEAVSVPAAAQLACTPLVAVISGQVSLVAVVANLAVAPVVGPATVLGLAGGLLGLVVPPLGRLCGTGAGWCVAWIVAVARRGSDLPGAAVEWGATPVAVVVLVLVCVVLVLVAPCVLRRPTTGIGCLVLLAVAVTVRLPTPGWPAAGWVLAMCDVGQGDALVLRAGPASGVVVDTGPDPVAVDGCLSRLGIESVPLLVLTHFHADHVDGLSGVLSGRAVGAVETTRVLDPPGGVETVTDAAADAGLAPVLAPYGAVRTVGDVTLQALWPRPGLPSRGAGDGSEANDASVVLLADVRGVRILLTGDLEPPGQEALAAVIAGLDVDVLKVPHHGSRYQDLDLLTSLGAELALVSVGDNDYGHPASDVLEALSAAGAEVLRTDTSGDVLVVPDGDTVVAVTR
ncbi:membrane protein [Nocardioides szechwanensis]|uniref:Competence protein ComEC n=1 Tax=Nocardioides szechwanensis TaxID=1005944 RepID=A0A1H0I669_9ACTN|nr:ComEC/Rec2 family competence protein [Nocardioides szechwanensis]GEP34409.1 membrane protein [Nocardioides szechwanensis]SDO26912.1 competence protein ComEC [Nocardioides szechwanensis]